MTTKRFTLFAIVMAAFALLVGCKKEKAESTISSTSETFVGMLHFNSAEEFKETLEKALTMSETERREWERQQGFKSYATKCEELFEEFEAKGINSDEDIYSFVKENSDYFYIREEEGEKYLASYYENSPYYHFMNCDQVFSVGDTIFKVFDNYLAKATLEKKEETLSLKEGCFEEGFDYYYFIDNVSTTKEYTCDCTSTESTFRSTKNNNRLYVRITIGPLGVANIYRCIYKLRPYHRVMGVWYYCSRTIYYNFTVNWKYKLSTDYYSPWIENGNTARDLQGTGSSCIEDYLLDESAFPDTWYNLQFTSFSGWAQTPDTPLCHITCPNL